MTQGNSKNHKPEKDDELIGFKVFFICLAAITYFLILFTPLLLAMTGFID